MSVVNKTIVRAELNADNDALALIDDSGKFHWFTAVGDCCSKSWYEHIDLPELPFKVKEAIELKWDCEYRSIKDDGDDGDYGDETKIYALQFKTSKGDLSIELRNSSNGYYGGEILYGETPLTQYNRLYEAGKMRDISETGL